MADWNPWHGCHKLSAGCANCYVYRQDAKHEKDSSVVTKNSSFDLPIKRYKNGDYKIKSGDFVWTCFTSDFLLSDADEWRREAWSMIKERSDLTFLFITKRIDRFTVNLPEDWGVGYENVRVCCTAENQQMADYRLPIFKELPILHKSIICEPLLGPINLSDHLHGDWVKEVVVGGESGNTARPCNYEWVLDIREQCIKNHVPFTFRQTGAKLVKDSKLYHIERKHQFSQAKKANIDYLK